MNMRKSKMNLTEIKEEIMKLKGKDVEMEVNQGRKKVLHYEGILEDIYHSVFVVKLLSPGNTEKISYSFSDVLCGDVKIGIKNK